MLKYAERMKRREVVKECASSRKNMMRFGAILAFLLAFALFAFCLTAAFLDFKNYALAVNELVYSFVKSYEGVKVINYDGDVIYIGEYSVASESLISAAIDKDRNGSAYTIKIGAPEISLESEGGVVAAGYSESEDKFAITSSYTHFMNASANPLDYKWSYKTQDGADFIQIEGSRYSTLHFGRGKAVGNYTIKVEFGGYASFNGRVYPTEKASAEFSVSVTSSDGYTVTLPDSRPELIYGDPANDVNFNRILFSSTGEWRLSDGQDNYKNKILDVGNYTLKFDFIPKNTNYNNISGLKVSFGVQKRPIKILIPDRQSKKGDELAKLSWELRSALAGGDTEAELGVSLTTDADKDVPGVYDIYGSIGNGNYAATFTNENAPDGSFSVTGKYTVMPIEVSVVIPDGAPEVSVNTGGDALPHNLKIIMDRSSSALPEGIKGTSVGAYDLSAIVTIEDAQGFTREELYDFNGKRINITLKSTDGADYVLYFDEGEFKSAYFDDNGVARISVDTMGTVFLMIGPETRVDYNAATVILACLIGAAAVSVIAIRKKYFGGRHGKRV